MQSAVSGAEYTNLNGEIKRTMKRSAGDMVRTGYLLRRMFEEKLWEAEYNCFDEYLERELHMDYSMATRFMNINRKYSVSGNSMEIDAKYKEYSQGLLIEMLSMPPELEAKVAPDMTVKQAREIKREAKQKNVKMKPDVRGLMDHAYCTGCGSPLNEDSQPERCPGCGQMQDWEWYNNIYGGQEDVHEDGVVDGEYREIDGSEEIATSQLTENGAHDKEWFVRQYVGIRPGTASALFEICRKEQNSSDRAKAIQKHMAPYGCSCSSCSEYDFSFYGFARGMDFRIGSEQIHLEYRHFAEELMKLLEGEGPVTEPDMSGTTEIRSAYGLEKTIYPEDSLLTTAGCGHKYSCFSCAQDCAIRQKDRYCVEAPMGNPFGCTTMEILGKLKAEMGDRCQFVDHSLAYHTSGSNEARPCCKDCQESCSYRCQRSAVKGTRPVQEDTADEIEWREGSIDLVEYVLMGEHKKLEDYLEFENDLPEMTVLRQKTIVTALETMLNGLKFQEGIEYKIEENRRQIK